MFDLIKSYIQKYAILGLSVLLALALIYAGILYLRCGQLGNKVEALNNKITSLEQDVEKALDANKSNMDTIDKLKKERDRLAKLNDSRLDDSAELAETITQNCALKGGTNVSQNTVMASPSNAVLDALNCMLREKGGDKDGPCAAADPGAPTRAPLQPGELVYCLREIDARNLLNDIALCRAWGRDGYNVIEWLKSTETGSN